MCYGNQPRKMVKNAFSVHERYSHNYSSIRFTYVGKAHTRTVGGNMHTQSGSGWKSTAPGNYVELVDSTDMCVHYFERQQQKLPDQAFNLCVYLYFNRCPDEKKISLNPIQN